jgi:hypothetical protein
MRLFLDRIRDRLVSASLPDDSKAVTNPESVVTTIKLQVNRFVGYGLSKLIQRQKTRVNREAKEADVDELLRELAFARSQRIFPVEALTMPTYLANCYDKTQALTNNGYLALLAPKYFEFGIQVMTAVAEAFTQCAFRKRFESTGMNASPKEKE